MFAFTVSEYVCFVGLLLHLSSRNQFAIHVMEINWDTVELTGISERFIHRKKILAVLIAQFIDWRQIELS